MAPPRDPSPRPHVSYRVDRTLDSKGQNRTVIFFTAFSSTEALPGAAIFAALTSDPDGDGRCSLKAARGRQRIEWQAIEWRKKNKQCSAVQGVTRLSPSASWDWLQLCDPQRKGCKDDGWNICRESRV